MADSIDAMKAELIDAGYKEDAELNWHWRGGNFGAYSATFPSIDSAYRHYEEGKRMAELEAHNARLLEVAREQQKTLEAHEALANEMIEAFNEAKDSSHLLAWLESIRNRTKKLTGKE